MTVFLVSCRDGFFVKDGRGWHTSAPGRAHSLAWPYPSTLLGAVRTAWGRRQEQDGGRAFTQADWKGALNIRLGKTVTLRAPLSNQRPGVNHRVWPVPLDALFMPAIEGGDSEVIRLDPVKPAVTTLGRDDDKLREALWRPALCDQRKPDPRPSWWPEETFVSWLAYTDERQKRMEDHEGFHPPRRFQAHVGIDPATGAAMEHILFAHDVIETLDKERVEWLLACEVHGWQAPPTGQIATLGADRRPARMQTPNTNLFIVPGKLLTAFKERKLCGLRLIAVTPIASDTGWLPQEFVAQNGEYSGQIPGVGETVVLLAALVSRPQHVSGWDMAQHAPKPTVRLIPPGSVFFVRKKSKGFFTEREAENLWLAALGNRTDEGLGRVVPGLWNPKEN